MPTLRMHRDGGTRLRPILLCLTFGDESVRGAIDRANRENLLRITDYELCCCVERTMGSDPLVIP